MVFAVPKELVVDELRAVVGIEAQQREGQRRPDLYERLEAPPLGLVAERADLGPTGCHAGEIEGLAELAAGIPAVVGDEVDLAEPRGGVVPFGEGADRDLPTEQGSGLGA